MQRPRTSATATAAAITMPAGGSGNRSLKTNDIKPAPWMSPHSLSLSLCHSHSLALPPSYSVSVYVSGHGQLNMIVVGSQMLLITAILCQQLAKVPGRSAGKSSQCRTMA